MKTKGSQLRLRNSPVWKKQNARRVELVGKSATLGLTPEEETELTGLQKVAEKRIGDWRVKKAKEAHTIARL
jgi:hypothetical protein